MKQDNKAMAKSFVGEKRFFYSKAVSRNIITDWIQGIRNTLGSELIAYTNVIDEATRELLAKVDRETAWFRIDTEQIGKGAFLIRIYGEYK